MSERPDGVQGSAQEWLGCAEDDLELAERGLEPPALTALACYHAQQAAEKALKGYRAWLGAEEIPRRHRFDELVRQIRREGGTPPDGDLVTPLQPYAVGVRYPGPPLPSLHRAQEALRLACEVVAHVRHAIGP
jgi:HEPN domain-containing protein